MPPLIHTGVYFLIILLYYPYEQSDVFLHSKRYVYPTELDEGGRGKRMSNALTKYLEENYIEVEPKKFYRFIFPSGELGIKGVYEKGKFNAIINEQTKELKKDGTPRHKSYVMTDDLDMIDDICSRDNFCVCSPISYIGRNRTSKNARVLYALAFDLDGIKIKNDGTPQGIIELFHQIENLKHLPMPTYIVSSGTGLHLYYVFEKPLMLFKNLAKELQAYKDEITYQMWNRYVTEFYRKPQYESLFQGFRMVGTITKVGTRVRAFQTGEKVTIEQMNSFVKDKFKVVSTSYKSKLSLHEAQLKYPEWYEKRIVKGQKKGTWTTKPALYEWWLEQIERGAVVGHRYYCIMMLAIYAKKAGISWERLEKDAYGLVEDFDSMPAGEDNPFTKSDVVAGLKAYHDKYITYPINSIEYLSGIKIEKNKRNYRGQSQHVKIMSATRDILYPDGSWRKGNGRPSAHYKVWVYKKNNPNATKADCIRDTGLSKPTVYKWWNKDNPLGEKYEIGINEFVEFLKDTCGEGLISLSEKLPDGSEREVLEVEND